MRHHLKVLANFLGATKQLTGQYVDLAGITEDELDQIRIGLLARDRRKDVVEKLATKGLSTREIAGLTGWSHQTIANDLNSVKKLTKTVKNLTALGSAPAPENIATSSHDGSSRGTTPVPVNAPAPGAPATPATPATKASATRTAHETIAKFAFNQPANSVPPGDPIRFGDFFNLSTELKEDSVDLIFTDPPYDDESIPLYGQMGEVAARVLKPGGSLVTYCGHMQLLKAGEALAAHLRFWQPLCCLHSGPAARLTEFGVVAQFKPMLWFVKGTRSDKHTFVDNVVTGQREKSHHDWQQAESEAAYFIEKLSPSGGFVADFFAGSGTTIIAAKKLGRSAVGYEIDARHYSSARERMSA